MRKTFEEMYLTLKLALALCWPVLLKREIVFLSFFNK